jgi:hypothetical protein
MNGPPQKGEVGSGGEPARFHLFDYNEDPAAIALIKPAASASNIRCNNGENQSGASLEI